MYDILQLNDLILPELKEIAAQIGLKNYDKLDKTTLVHAILDAQALSKKETAEDKPISEKARRPRTKKSTAENTEKVILTETATESAEPKKEVVEDSNAAVEKPKFEKRQHPKRSEHPKAQKAVTVPSENAEE